MSRRTRNNAGLIGLGIIGSRVADNLRRKGFQAYVWNRSPKTVPNFVGSPGEVAQLCDFIQLFVSNDEALLETVRQLAPNLTAQHVVLAHCTVAPESMRAAAEIAQRRGARFLDAPFTGSKSAAENGQLVYYIGGDEAALKHARPVLEASSKAIVYIGDIGQATVIKIATNMITAATVQVAAEALALVQKSGLAPEKLPEALKDHATNSATLGMKLGQMIKGDFEPHFSVKHMLKDVRIAQKMGQALALDFPASEVASEALLQEIKNGRGDQDFAVIARRYFPEPAKAEAVVQENKLPERAPEPPPTPQVSVPDSGSQSEQAAPVVESNPEKMTEIQPPESPVPVSPTPPVESSGENPSLTPAVIPPALPTEEVKINVEPEQKDFPTAELPAPEPRNGNAVASAQASAAPVQLATAGMRIRDDEPRNDGPLGLVGRWFKRGGN